MYVSEQDIQQLKGDDMSFTENSPLKILHHFLASIISTQLLLIQAPLPWLVMSEKAKRLVEPRIIHSVNRKREIYGLIESCEIPDQRKCVVIICLLIASSFRFLGFTEFLTIASPAPVKMGLVEYIHPALTELDYKQPRVKIAVIGSSFLAFAVIYGLSAIIAAFTWTYRNLRTKEKVFWNLAVVRAIFGIFATINGLHAIFVDTELEKDPAFATTPTTYFALSVTVGFFLFECAAILISDVVFRSASWLLNIHHWLSLTGYSLVLYMESTHFFGAKGLILEMSTPFSALCWTLLKCGRAQSMAWKINQFFLVHTFHCRSMVECFLWYVTYKHWDRIWEAMPTAVFCSLYIQLTLITFLMTPYWTYKKTAQLFNPVDWNFEDADINKVKNGDFRKRD